MTLSPMSVVLAPMRIVPYIMIRTQTRSTSTTHSRQWTPHFTTSAERRLRSASFGIAQGRGSSCSQPTHRSEEKV
jgi:hypothetical protein